YWATPSVGRRAVSGVDSETPTNLGPLSAEGMTEARLTAAITSQIIRMGPTNRSTFDVEPTCSPAKIAWRVLSGMLVAIIAKVMERLSRTPVVTSVADIPDATPLLVTGVAFMIELILGATNIPPPAPASIIGMTSVPYEIR